MEGLLAMYFPQNDYNQRTDEGEKLTTPSKDPFRKLHILLSVLIVITSIIMAENLCQFMYWAYHADKGSLGSILTIICFLVYDFFIIRTIFYKGEKQRIYRFKLRSVFASTSTLITILLTYMFWAAENKFRIIALTPVLCLCLNFILNFILDRLKPAKAQVEATHSMMQTPSVPLRPRPRVEPNPEFSPMPDLRRRYPPVEDAHPMMQTPPEQW
jgi:F0F1-type ATP synthase assembly protein I